MRYAFTIPRKHHDIIGTLADGISPTHFEIVGGGSESAEVEIP